MSSALLVFTLLHVAISLVGIAAGAIVAQGLLTANRRDTATAVFLASTLATSLTGFGFPFTDILPSHIVGAISLVVVALAIVARYKGAMVGRWRASYVVSALAGFYFNVFVLVIQLFLKVPALKALAPTQSEPPFAIAQLLVLASFIALGILALRRFRVPTASRTARPVVVS